MLQLQNLTASINDKLIFHLEISNYEEIDPAHSET